MIGVLLIFGITIVAMVCSILFWPTIKIKTVSLGTYWMIVLLGAVILVCTQLITPKEIYSNLTADTAVNPLKILTLFISMALISIFLDEVGFFKMLAGYIINKSSSGQVRLFFSLYITVSVLTVFTSNDIIILTFTPFICYFAKSVKIDPLPYLIGEFIAANTWSMFLIIGNPTNIYLATAANLSFAKYTLSMWAPTVFSGLTSLCVLMLIFYKRLLVPLSAAEKFTAVVDRPLMVIGLADLAVCTVMLVISNYVGLEMWVIALSFAAGLLALATFVKLARCARPTAVIEALKHAPWELVPFVLSMFVFVQALGKHGVSEKLAHLLAGLEPGLVFGTLSLVSSNVINNIPTSVLFSSVLQSAGERQTGLFATIIGTNIGAFLTPIGALAGIMWLGILKKQNVQFTFLSFCKYGVLLAFPTLYAAVGGLYFRGREYIAAIIIVLLVCAVAGAVVFMTTRETKRYLEISKADDPDGEFEEQLSSISFTDEEEDEEEPEDSIDLLPQKTKR